MPSTTQLQIRVAIKRTRRWPFATARLLGRRAQPKEGEYVARLRLVVDDALLDNESPVVTIEVKAPPAPVVHADQT